MFARLAFNLRNDLANINKNNVKSLDCISLHERRSSSFFTSVLYPSRYLSVLAVFEQNMHVELP